RENLRYMNQTTLTYDKITLSYDKITTNNSIFRNDIFHYGDSYADILKLLIENNVRIPDHTIFEILPEKFYNRDFFVYLISNGIDINKKFIWDGSKPITIL